MPARICSWTCLSAAIVTLLAACMSASSAGDLTMRQARTSSSPGAMCGLAAAAAAIRSTMKKRVVASMASGPPWPDRARRLRAARRGSRPPSRAHVGGDLQCLADRGLLEGGCDDDHRSFGGNERRGRALGAPPADTGEVLERGTGLDQHCAGLALLHEPLQLGEPRPVLLGVDRPYVPGEGAQPARGCARVRREGSPGRDRGAGRGQPKKLASGHSAHDFSLWSARDSASRPGCAGCARVPEVCVTASLPVRPVPPRMRF